MKSEKCWLKDKLCNACSMLDLCSLPSEQREKALPKYTIVIVSEWPDGYFEKRRKEAKRPCNTD
jgi:hypothetical protein